MKPTKLEELQKTWERAIVVEKKAVAALYEAREFYDKALMATARAWDAYERRGTGNER